MHRAKGTRYEHAAEQFLSSRGLRALQRSFNCRLGEIDLIMLDGDCLVFIEVRYRASIEFGTPLETITLRKRRRIVRAAAVFLQRERRFSERPCRFDAVGITGPDEALAFDWIKAAFSA